MIDESESKMVEGRAEYSAAVDAALAQAEREILVLDQDLSIGGWETEHRADLLRDFCLRASRPRIVFVLRDLAFVRTRCARLVALLQRLSHAMEIRQLREEYELSHSLVLVPPRTCLYRVHPEARRARLATRDAQTVAEMRSVFDGAYPFSDPGVPAATLGLG